MLEGTATRAQKGVERQTRCEEKVLVDLIRINVFPGKLEYSIDTLDMSGTLYQRLGTIGTDR